MKRQPPKPGQRRSVLQSHYEWLVPVYGGRLHYVAGITSRKWETWYDRPYGEPGWREASTACHRQIKATLPGFLSRMGLGRCAACCRALGIKQGFGTLLNERGRK